MILPYDYFNKLTVVMSTYLAYCMYVRQSSVKTRIWTRDMFSENEREMHGFFSQIFTIMKNNNSEQFRKVTRMGVPQFELLYSLLKPKLTKTSHRRPIEAECRLVLTLVYLSQGSSWYALSGAFRLGYTTVREIILETCETIWNVLHPIYLAEPNENEWERISNDIYNTTSMPNCVGAIDGKHVKIKLPPNAGSLYSKCKSSHSIVLLAACDSNYCFTAVDIAAYDGQSDGGVLGTSAFCSKILNETINLPTNKCLPNSIVRCPYYFIGDAAFPLKKSIMRPYPGCNLSKQKDMFNKTLSNVQVMIENAFGVMTARWRVLLNSINCFPENAEKIVKACVALHNFVILNDEEYCPPSFVDTFDGNKFVKGLWRRGTPELPQSRLLTRCNATRTAFHQRDLLMNYITIN